MGLASHFMGFTPVTNDLCPSNIKKQQAVADVRVCFYMST